MKCFFCGEEIGAGNQYVKWGVFMTREDGDTSLEGHTVVHVDCIRELIRLVNWLKDTTVKM